MRTHGQIVREAGTDSEIADKLGAKQHQVRDWRLRDFIPAERWSGFAANGWATLEELADAAEAKRLPQAGAAAA